MNLAVQSWHRGDWLVGQRFIPELEATRGVAAFLVAGFHVGMARAMVDGVSRPLVYEAGFERPIWNALRHVYRFFASGYGDPATPSVLFFFVLSGFVLAKSMQDRRLDLRTVTGFVKSRAFRLYPAVIGSVLLLCAWYAATGLAISGPEQYELPAVVHTMFLLSTGMSGVLWTLQVEVLAIPLLILLFVSRSHFRIWGPAALTFISTALVFWPQWREIGGPPPKLFWAYAFCFGAMAAYLPVKFSRTRPSTVALIAFAVLIAVPGIRIGSNIFRALVDAFAAACLVSALATGEGGALARALNHPVLRFYGRISFSLYLLHPLALTVIWNMPVVLGNTIAVGVPSAILAATLWVVSVAVITPLAWASHRWIELPAMRFGRRPRQPAITPAETPSKTWDGVRK
jgi:peptidoglycan/LPS O-acetylase OafA/YrhL